MKTYKCDACGKYYDRIPKIKFKTNSSGWEREVSGIRLCCTDTTSDPVFDLCEDCMRKIVADLNILY